MSTLNFLHELPVPHPHPHLDPLTLLALVVAAGLVGLLFYRNRSRNR